LPPAARTNAAAAAVISTKPSPGVSSVSMSQASADIARYLARNPPGVVYDKSAKRYAAPTDFRPLLAKPDATRFLGELRLVEVGLLAVEDTMLGVVPPFDATPVPERSISSISP
jgi:hypothetical protein